MTDYKCGVSLKVADKIYSQLTQAGYDVEVFEGVLLDSYFCEIGKNTKFRFTLKRGGRVKLRKYLWLYKKLKMSGRVIWHLYSQTIKRGMKTSWRSLRKLHKWIQAVNNTVYGFIK